MLKYDFEAIIFDMDGVITDTEPLHVEAERLTCAEFDLRAPVERWEGFKGRTTLAIFEALIAEFGAGRRDLDSLVMAERKLDHYLRLATQGLPLVPGVVDFIKQARRHCRHIGLATSSERPIQEVTFRRHALAPYFDAITTGSELTYGKPHPEAYLKAVAKAGCAAGKCLVIEDSDNGIKSAKAAGCLPLGITTSFPPEYLVACGATDTFDRYQELPVRFGWQ